VYGVLFNIPYIKYLAHVPLDWMFRTFPGSKDDISKIWKNQKAGREANKTPVHSELDAKKEI